MSALSRPAPEQSSRHWHILDPALFGALGHHLSHARAITRELQRRSVPATVYGSARLEPEKLGRLRVKPWFRHSPHTWNSADPVRGEHEDFVRGNRTMAEDLARLDRAQFHRRDLVLFPTVTFNELQGIIAWAAGFQRRQLPKIVVMLMFPPDWAPLRRTFSNPALYYRAAVDRCPPDLRARLHLCVETPDMAALYAPVLGVAPSVLPMPIAEWEGASAARGIALGGRVGDEPLVAYLGHSRREKGMHLLPETALLLAQQGRRLRLFVQSSHFGEEPLVEAERRLAAQPSVTLHRGALSRDDYLSVLLGADLVLLPYDAAIYATRGSGVFYEAEAAGAPLVVPEGTWMARAVADDGNGVAFAGFAPAAIAAGVATALDRLDALRACARAIAERMRREHSAAAYVDRVESL